MPITNAHAGTRIDEIAASIYRISTPVPPNPALPAGFTFNQFLIVDDEPLLFHTGLRRMFPFTREAVASVMPVDKLKWVSFGHFEADECGSLAEWLAIAPQAAPLCGRIGAMLSIGDISDRAPRVLADGESIEIGTKRVRWFDTPHLPHGWDAGTFPEPTPRPLFSVVLPYPPPPSTPRPGPRPTSPAPRGAARGDGFYYTRRPLEG